jgi:hypothetical protein
MLKESKNGESGDKEIWIVQNVGVSQNRQNGESPEGHG